MAKRQTFLTKHKESQAMRYVYRLIRSRVGSKDEE